MQRGDVAFGSEREQRRMAELIEEGVDDSTSKMSEMEDFAHVTIDPRPL